jgi:O-antigen ligase
MKSTEAFSILQSAKVRAGPPIRLGLLLATLSVVVGLVLEWLPTRLVSWDGVRIVGVAAVLLTAMCLSGWSTAQTDPNRASLKSLLIIWTFLLISEQIFSRGGGDAESAFKGRFSVAAYGEASLWILAFMILLLLSLKIPPFFRYMFSGQFKWLSMFGLLCLLSAVYSPRQLFSVVWAFKLCLVISVLGICSRLIRVESDILIFVRATFWACSFLVFAPIWNAFADPSTGFEGARLGASPTSLSVIAGLVLVLSFTLRFSATTVWRVIFGIVTVIASTVMILAAGKAGIVGGLLSMVLLFLIKKKIGSAVVVLSGMIGLGVVLFFLSTPLQSYFDTYAESGQVDSLTGRTGLWAAALPAIGQSPILGHGYMASKFVSLQLEGVEWDASHLHNAFLEVLYNNGLIGLLLLLFMHGMVIKNLIFVIRYPGATRGLYEIAVGFLALYANILINSIFNAIIGGRPSDLFLIFLAIFMLSESLRKQLSAEECLPRGTKQNRMAVYTPGQRNSVTQT